MNDQTLKYFEGDTLATEAWLNKYALNGENTPDDMHKRLSLEYAKIEKEFVDNDEYFNKKIETLSQYGEMRFKNIYNILKLKGLNEYNQIKMLQDEIFYPLLKDFKYIVPGGSIMANLGKNSPTSLSNCFVIGQPEDNIDSIFEYAKQAAQLYKRRGGVGIDISILRPQGANVNNASKTSTGSVSFMELYSNVTNLIGQSGRRGALMISMDINHPDILDFITIKQDLTKVTGANISIKTNAEFMKAVENDEDYILRFPCDWKINKETFFTPNTDDLMTDGNGHYWRKVRAKKIWNTLIECAHKTAEPGILFWDNHLNQDPAAVYDEYRPVSTNPCGEIPLQPKDSCRLHAVNLYSLVRNPFTEKAFLDMDLAYSVFYEQMIMGDNLVELELKAIDKILDKINPEWLADLNDMPSTWLDKQTDEFKLWYEIKETGANSRRIGNGFTALADMFAALNIKYGDSKSKQGFSDLMLIKLRAEIDATVDLAKLRGAFKGYDFNKEYEIIPKQESIIGYNKFYQHILNVYPEGVKKMIHYGRRNVSFSTIAPTGTVSLMTQTSSGIEPLFSPYYKRRMKVSTKEESTYIDVDGQMFKEFIVIHPKLKMYAQIAKNIDITKEYNEEFWKEIYENSPYYNSCVNDIKWEDRLEIQRIAQKKTTHSISSTLNLPNDVTIEEVNEIYKTAYIIGLKGITIYRDGSRGGILVNTDSSENSKFTINKAPKRPKTLEADIYTLTNSGIKYLVAIGLFNNKPYEVFVKEIDKNVNINSKIGKITKIKQGHYKLITNDYICENLNDDLAIEKKATALYVSMLLRHGADIKFIIKTAKKVDDNIASFTSAMNRVLSKYVEKEVLNDLCPECGSQIIREAGCEKCTNCTYSKCLMIYNINYKSV